MRTRTTRASAGGQLAAAINDDQATLWIELTAADGNAALARFTAGEALMAIETIAMAYGDLLGAQPDSIARGVNRTLRNRTRAARERQRIASERTA